MSKKTASHIEALIRNLPTAELLAKLEFFGFHSYDHEMTARLIAEAKRRGL